MPTASLFSRIGETKLRAVVTEFYARVFPDEMIGFLFQGKNRAHLIEKEYEFTARLLGADVKYTGRPMRTAHAQLPIFGGHFERRLQILRETLADLRVDLEVAQAWIEHTRLLRSQITPDHGSECKDTAATAPKLRIAVPSDHSDTRIVLGRK